MKRITALLSSLVIFAVVFAFNITAYADNQTNLSRIELLQTSYTYSGSEIVPSFKVFDENGSVVVNDESNFDIVTINSTNTGTATLRIIGKNSYAGELSANYTINPRSISSASATSFKVVLGKSTVVGLKYNNANLVKNVDYTYDISPVTKAGQTATITFKGLGNFTGTKTLQKIVYPCTVTGIKDSGKAHNGFNLTWTSLKNKGVTNYKVYKCDSNGNNRKLVCDTTNNSAKITGYNAGDYCYLVIRAYVNVNGTNYYSDYSGVYKTVTKPKTVISTKTAKSTDNGKLIIGWDKVPCTGYQVQYTTDKAFKKGIKTFVVNGGSNTAKTISIQKNNRIYYSRVRAFRKYKYNNKEYVYYGSWSSILSTQYNKVYASYKTAHVQNKNRTTNLILACKAINGTVLMPGEVFSFNKVVGKRTAAKGYKPATIFTGSSGTAQSLGGGICQVASTLFNTALLGNMGIVERYQHSQRVSYCPLGRDAAIFWGSEDFKFKNTSKYPIKIEMKCQNGYVYCTFKVSYDVAPSKVSLKVTRSGNTFTLRRYVNGKCNYTTKSKY